MSTKQRGKCGETIAVNYLINKGFEILSRNCRVLGVEIDIIAYKNNIKYFIEVKTVACLEYFNISYKQLQRLDYVLSTQDTLEYRCCYIIILNNILYSFNYIT